MKDEEIYDLAEFFKVFADATRIKIIAALLEKELCVCELAEIVGTTQSAISRQLRILKQSHLVKFRREKTCLYYTLSDAHIRDIFLKGREHIEEI